jgi:hypothetical protein
LPGSAGPPPPPPPGLGGLTPPAPPAPAVHPDLKDLRLPQLDIPRPKAKMKTLNWVKLPDIKVNQPERQKFKTCRHLDKHANGPWNWIVTRLALHVQFTRLSNENKKIKKALQH